MRFTQSLLFPILRRRMKDISWQRWRNQPILDTGAAAALEKDGIKVVDANQFVRNMDRDIYPTSWESLPDAKPIFPTPPRLDRSHPDWHDEPIFTFDSQSFPIEGLNQALVFTKSIKQNDGLPENILNGSSLDTPEIHNQAKSIVQQAFLWDAYLEKLPQLMNFDFPTRKFSRQYGTPLKRSNEIVLRNFLRLVENEKRSLAAQRLISSEGDLRVNVQRCNHQVQFRLNPLMCLMSTEALQPVVEKGVVSQYDDVSGPDIYPFSATANFEDTNIYREGDYFLVSENSKFRNIHTAFFSHHIPGSHTHLHPRWTHDRFAGTTVMYAFAVALLMARRIHGNVNSDLPTPVTSQVVHSTGKEMQFSVFQLNTLELESKSETKNLVWLTEKIPLFETAENNLGKESFEGYNPLVLSILFNLYCR